MNYQFVTRLDKPLAHSGVHVTHLGVHVDKLLAVNPGNVVKQMSTVVKLLEIIVDGRGKRPY